ncbi:hypothetical protein A2303_06415 [Candidatus Falkowbacteria bacterium RIFOXYB2_FULL_47_14]|uniref:Uncharacterized protein n=1 Tax=Candidatus Falkowbacteria bacterium RIFOXYA2_FULL_47_19 TaxID=1797994 RepID=A0A1F5SJ38_9BACT|nr:MAG: hypothetical protein A2227_06405 [Candidatus Falkowbacteria bacterium RIFOXYA2_FULL_47_19]OGF35720.1 MAG: hypothetical protein A2468_05080 [Candidatus Falkowbacteria bacterium RIFOXYC2_FULL_46_15]OGF43975.1 MAG: hypothetical protein A2303_06415 [Candidatus Falkowbacteria bacterium RIFOXYB2_FULL_47_14]
MDGVKPKNSSISNFKGLPLILAASLVLFFLSGFALARTDFIWRFFYVNSRPATDHFLRKAAELRLISREKSGQRVFLVGSSVAYEGYDEDYLNLRTPGTEFYNFGSGGVTPIELFLLRNEYIARRPDTVVFPVFVGDFYGKANYASLKYFFKFEILPRIISIVGWRDLYDHRREMIDSMIGRIVPFYRYNKSIIRSIEAAARDRVLGIYSGAPEVAKKTGQMSAGFFEELAAVEPKFKRTEHTELRQRLFLDYARDLKISGVKLVVVRAPMNSRVTEISAPGLEEEMDDWLRAAAAEYGFMYIGKSELPAFADNEFVDFTHLNEKGREKNSAFLLDYLDIAGYLE